MPREADVLVIGGGVVGVSSAWYLASRGRGVTLLDRGGIASGCSHGNAGLVVPSHSIPLAAPGVLGKGLRWMCDPGSPFYIKPRLDLDLALWLWRFVRSCRRDRVRRAIPLLRDLSRASLALFEALAVGTEFGLTKRGLLLVYRSARGFEEGREEAHVLSEAGLAVRVLEAPRDLVPALREGTAGGVHYLEDAHLDPLRFVRQIAARAERKGVEILTEAEVLGFGRSRGRIETVRTRRGDFRPAEVVLAAGSWSPQLARGLGLRIPIQPGKGYSVTAPSPPDPPRIPLILCEARVAVTPIGNLLRFAGTMELAGMDLSINRRRVEAIRRAARKYLSGADGLESAEVWRGLRPCTPDGLPVLGRPAGFANLIVAAGHAMIGLSLGPVTGLVVSQMACGERPPFDLSLLSPDRF